LFLGNERIIMKISDVIVSIVTGICVLVTAVLTKNILSALFGPVCMLVVYLVAKDKIKKSKICSSPIFWSLAIILVTLAILALYAI